MTDEFAIQQLLETGLVSHSQAPRHTCTILQINYPPVLKYMSFARDLARREAQEEKLSCPFESGIPLFPVRLNPYGAVEWPEKDPRLCCDLSSPQTERDGGGKLSINEGIPFHDTELLAKMKPHVRLFSRLFRSTDLIESRRRVRMRMRSANIHSPPGLDLRTLAAAAARGRLPAGGDRQLNGSDRLRRLHGGRRRQ